MPKMPLENACQLSKDTGFYMAKVVSMSLIQSHHVTNTIASCKIINN